MFSNPENISLTLWSMRQILFQTQHSCGLLRRIYLPAAERLVLGLDKQMILSDSNKPVRPL
jgi:hypothetical protein